jgi:hypothetical protein
MLSFIGIAHRIVAYGYIDECYGWPTAYVWGLDFEPRKYLPARDCGSFKNLCGLDTFSTRGKLGPSTECIEVMASLTPYYLHYPIARRLVTAFFAL